MQETSIARLSPHSVGALGELQAIRELLTRGYFVATPVVPGIDPVDLIVNHKVCVQVKAAAAPVAGTSGYKFRGNTAASVDHAEVVDVFMLYALDIDAWWILPAERVRELTQSSFLIYLEPRAAVGPGRPRNDDSGELNRFRDAWWVLEGFAG